MRIEIQVDGTTGEVTEIQAWAINDELWREDIELPAGLMASIGVQLQQKAWGMKE